MPSDEIDLFGFYFCVRIHNPLPSEWSTGQDAVEIVWNRYERAIELALGQLLSLSRLYSNAVDHFLRRQIVCLVLG